MCPGPLLVMFCQVKRKGCTELNRRSGRPKKLTDRDIRTLKRTERNNLESGLPTIAEEFRCSSGTEAHDRTQFLFYGLAAPQKPLITRTNVHRRLE